MRTYRSLMIAALSVVVTAAAAGCGSSKPSASASTTTAAPTSTVPATTTTTIDETAAKTAISAAFASFLNSADPNYDGRLALVQDGASVRSVFIALESANAKVASTGRVTNVEFMSADDCSSNGFNSACAAVTYDVLVAGKVALGGSKGYAVLDNGTWKVAKVTFCALASLGGMKCPSG